MARIEHSETINRPPADVFEFAVNPENWPLWRTGILEVAHSGGPRMGAGSTWRIAAAMMGRDVEMTLEVTDYEVDRRVGFRSVSGPVQLQGTFTFEPADGSTRISLVAEAQAGGIFRMAEGLMVRQAGKIWEDDMATLKGIMEA